MTRSCVACVLAAVVILSVGMASALAQDAADPGVSGEVDQREIDRLVNDLKATGFATVMKASDALVEIGEPSIPALRRLLESASDKWVRVKVVNVLKRIPSPQSIAVLFQCLSDPDPNVKDAAASGIVDFASKGQGDAASLIAPALVDESASVRREARKMLTEMGWTSEDFARELTAAISGSDATKRAVALEELRELGPAAGSAMPHLMNLLSSPDLDLRSTVALLGAVISIGGAQIEDIYPQLQAILLKGDEASVEQSIDMLLSTGCSVEEIAAPMVDLLRNGDEDVRSKAIDALVQLSRRRPSAARVLVSVLEDESNDLSIRTAAYRALEDLLPHFEDLDRGPVAVKVSEGVYVGWRLLATDPSDISFEVYRDGVKITPEPITSSTNLLDPDGRLDSLYQVNAIVDGKVWSQTPQFAVWEKPYLSIPLEKPQGGVSKDGVIYSYEANDASAADLDGDGEYEIVLKWDPTNAHDNAHDGYTGEVYLDAYKLNGTRLWRINLGKNIRAGAHYTQFMVYDLDGDGKAEVACKTADGTVDGLGQVIGDPNADYRTSVGRILSGPEYLTIFEGETGKALVTVDYEPPRGRVSDWGDNYGNRVDRFLACIAYLDGKMPSLVMCRGYYTRTVLVAYNWRDDKLTKVWTFDSNKGYPQYEGQGNHNLSVADVDFDGKDEIIYGACAIDHDGTGLYNTRLGHGDAMHLGYLDPDRPGFQVFAVHEPKPNPAGIEFRDAATGELLWGIPTDYDVGRGLCADIDPRYPGEEAWAANSALYSCKGDIISHTRPSSINFAIWWDGDLLRELLDSNRIDKWDYTKSTTVNLMTAAGCSSNNGTKATPCLQADILGDWREEVIWKTANSSELRIFTTTHLTDYRIPTLMHDHVYRLGVAWQNVAYNQPPHTGFHLGHGMTLPELVWHDVKEALRKHSAIVSEGGQD
jgi:rhamnogalacturonan endolyase